MMPRKKRITLMIAIVVVILLAIAISIILLYLNTDLFKSNQTLFTKYFAKNLENLAEIENYNSKTTYEELLNTSPYTENLEMKINYTKNIGTTSETTSNAINTLKIVEEGQVDKTNQYDEKTIKLLNGEEQKMQIEYIKDNNTYGIRFSDLFNQYVLAENNNLKDLLSKAGVAEEKIANIPDSIDINSNILEEIKLTNEEKETIKEEYLALLVQDMTNSNFEKQKDQIISINEENIVVNTYIMKLTKEQLNNIYIRILEKIKEDEIFLSKIEKIQNKIDIINTVSTDQIDLKEKIISSIDTIIEKINRSNIGNDETKILVYESEGQTVRTTIQGVDYEINFDYLPIDGEQFSEIKFTNQGVENWKITLNQNANKVSLEINNNNEETPIKLTYEKTKKEEENNGTINNLIRYEKGTDKVEANIMWKTNLISNIQNQITLNNENSVKLNDLDEAQTQTILNRIKEGLNTKIDGLKQEINIEEIQEPLKVIGILKEENILEGNGVSETEKNRFNSGYEILQGENLNTEAVLNVINTIQNNLINMEVASNEVLKLEISNNNGNAELVNTLKEFIEKQQNVSYNVTVEYDDVGLVKYIVLTIVNPEE